MAARTASIRVDESTLDRVDRLAEAMDRSRSWVIAKAIEQYLDHEEWFVRSVEEGITAADRGDLHPHNAVIAELRRKLADSGS